MPSYRRTLACVAALFVATPALAQEVPAVGSEPADVMPEPPIGIAATYVTPIRDARGIYATPNRDLSPAETTWHVRAALNVAALGCRGEGGAEIVAAYNAMLDADRAPLAQAMDAVETAMRGRVGIRWQAESDGAMTRLYNYFAAPPAQAAFCAAARDVLRQAATVEPDAFPLFAADALPRLEAPFLALFAACDDWRMRVAAWRVRHAVVPDTPRADIMPPVLIATAASVSAAHPIALRTGPEGP